MFLIVRYDMENSVTEKLTSCLA